MNLLVAATILAALSDYMSEDEMKKTGVETLNKTQKQHLEEWIKKNMPDTEATSNKYITMSENIDGGKILKLSDGSKWEVDPRDLSTSELWLFTFPVKVSKKGNGQFPYEIKNLNTGSIVRAQKINS